MPLRPRKPTRLIRDLEHQIDAMFDELIHEPWGRLAGAVEWQPEIDLYETEDAYILEADLPGVLPQDVEVRVDDHRLTIRGTRKSAELVDSAQGVFLERRHGSFSRRFSLEHAVDVEKIESRSEAGIYNVRLPKKKD